LDFLFVHGLTTIFLVSGLGTEDQQNGLHKVHVISFCMSGSKRNLTSHTHEHWMN
jgi:hypothetical protein